jgi:xanthine dehydrogenase accessory factor
MKIQVWRFIVDQLKSKTPVLLMYVIDSIGSSPGRKGFAMAVNAQHQMIGSIGGGIMEHKFVELCKHKLQNNWTGTEVHRQVHDKKAPHDQSGMICSGEQTIVIYRCIFSDINIIENIVASYGINENGVFYIKENGLYFESISNQNVGEESNKYLYKESMTAKPRLYIVGGGHCSLALSKIMYDLDFEIFLFETRTELNTFVENNSVHHKLLLDDYHDIAQHIDNSENNYIVIMTMGYRYDDIVVRSIFDKEFKYIGILGSKAKINHMKIEYEKSKFPLEKLKNLYAPAGISIDSHTPTEIAVSIAAQLIQIRRQQ